jgi:hypothetical protein
MIASHKITPREVYIFNLTINRTFDGFLREKSVVNDGLTKIFPEVTLPLPGWRQLPFLPCRQHRQWREAHRHNNRTTFSRQ